ncbi:YbhB/YbcL family Raf kinase inhibitor-like protein [Sulfuracidifex metallicus]|jgi:Raf kinase inhibitor-like YbhB/YbcL family protein|uniref:YbhB/YbcL family Raf kinase inhibitor-like protein n=1 Tax=Sulfuracidifex metallicus DSM 6482 = JCM 9184 TaxID=523847 RepID=A0A6A9QSE5_SULME|nr:YbhB/YbcL family Raf kinase inhibitor-like protein [Sulfuracidifex metallicus]MUN28072.1 YbhB/YbcL family Raf kinase inhibitor-like protein [Sulfuracidifex metallicus DSM 6482 = JCM 9184]WOE51383.1 YbhB/YbcL family Raf kinase inhibitor-like protein [Sulfuracidifex metallicus DSM 6482 = JCM 9184]
MIVKAPFKEGEEIPQKFTCEGDDVSPHISWDKVDGAKSYALIMEDPDAPSGLFVHWIIYNIKTNSLAENMPRKERINEIIQGENDFGNIGYGGPCPPKSHPAHRYFIRVYALDAEVTRKMSLEELREFISSHKLDSGEIMGLYKRKR